MAFRILFHEFIEWGGAEIIIQIAAEEILVKMKIIEIECPVIIYNIHSCCGILDTDGAVPEDSIGFPAGITGQDTYPAVGGQADRAGPGVKREKKQ